MLPLGLLALGKRRTRFTPDEQRTMMSLWSIARSPLIMGGDLRALDADTLALLTNDAVLAVNQHGTAARQLFRTGNHIGWTSRDARSGAHHLALFNIGETAEEVGADLSALGFSGSARVRDLWAGSDLEAKTRFAVTLPPHGSGLYRLS
jgi:hypothetical protein